MPELELCVGVGSRCMDISKLSVSYHRAKVAAHMAIVQKKRVIKFDECGLFRLLYMVEDKGILKELEAECLAALEEHDIPVVLHLDHGPDFETCKMCIDNGFSSVMIDGSKYDFEENVRLTKQVVDYAHEHGVVVEAELGKLAGIEDEVNVTESDAIFTDPEQAKEFVERTGCDSLAIAIGTSHGAYKFKGEPKLRFDILQKVKELIPNTPIVLHGASTVIPELVETCNKYGGNIPGAKGVPDEILNQASKLGVSKINVDTDLRLAMTSEIRRVFVEDPSAFDPRKYLTPAREAVKQTVKHKIRDVFGASNKA